MIKIFKNFLSEEEALDLSTKIYDTPEHWWATAIKSDDKEPIYLSNSLRDFYSTNLLQQDLVNRLLSGNFSYKFKRSTTHVNNCTCYECTFAETHLNNTIKNKVLEVTSWKNCEIAERFTSAYGPGDFLSLHTDENRGVAFILNLTMGWKPEFGGMLNVLQEDGTFKAIFPEFNSLILMEIDECGGTPHFVSEISQYAPNHRVAISGWYNEVRND